MKKASIRATAVGFTAILMWATLAFLTKLSGALPPFQLTAMAFTLASLIGLGLRVRAGKSLGADRGAGPYAPTKLPMGAWLNGLWGLFGYHFFYFIALQNAPAVEASLIAYLWPLLIVLLSACLPGERLRWFHCVGALAGFIGAGLLVTSGQGLSFNPQYLLGYLAALVCAFTWSGYSVLSRKFGAVPTSAVGSFCAVTAGLAWICHGLWETTVWPVGGEWGAIAFLGLGPIGLAFYTWDYGVKHGSIKALGALSYLAPLLSTLLLVATGFAEASWSLGLACLLIVGGAILASGDLT
ncbi:EamA family transporter [Pseudanabaena sp. FACHB-2040]|uniref:aromatic amino acid exporter YddG n=1 Tax=Pseudanabaena sp. FACHB-2040 TaxID=2692859 RepID=UPI001F549A86|nr:EamA family transporter [Pseudanabaena sp. FACHB-2040]